MQHHTNLTRIKAVAAVLKELNEKSVFVGGATVSLYADDVSAETRPTDDVDVVMELASYAAYTELDQRLRDVGFVNDTGSPIICRYQIQGITVDIMPTRPNIIGFSNKWYPEGFENADTITLRDTVIRIFTLPYFIASKLEAFKSRGGSDYRLSTDFEDIVFVLENNEQAGNLLLNAPANVGSYLKEEFSRLLIDPGIEEGIYAHLEPINAPRQLMKIMALLARVAEAR